jgi:hypothetical protein
MKTTRTTYALILVIALITSGCLPPTLSKNNRADSDQIFMQMKKADFAREIKKHTAITKSRQASTKEKAEAHRQLAIIYLIPRNPKRSEKKALNELGKYLEMTPGGLDRATAASWATAIRSSRDYRELERKIKKLDSENRQLATHNAKLEENIEKLKNLDLSLEKKKKSFR